MSDKVKDLIEFQFNLICASEGIYDLQEVHELLQIMINHRIRETEYYKIKSELISYGFSEDNIGKMHQLARKHPTTIKLDEEKSRREKAEEEDIRKQKLDMLAAGFFVGIPVGIVSFYLLNYLFFKIIFFFFAGPNEGMQIFTSYLVVFLSAGLSSLTISVNRYFAGFILLTHLILAFYYNFYHNELVVFLGI